MVRDSWVMGSLEQHKMLRNQSAWLEKFSARLSLSMISMLSLVQCSRNSYSFDFVGKGIYSLTTVFRSILTFIFVFAFFLVSIPVVKCLFLDQYVWLSRSGIYKNKERTELIGRISLSCWLGSSICSTLVEIGEIGRLSISMKKPEKELKTNNKSKNGQYKSKVQESNERTLAFVKAALDIVVAVGLLQLAPKKVTPRVSGAVGFVSSLISCYLLLPSPSKAKTT